MDRIRPSTSADCDAFLTESLVEDTGHSCAGGLVLESEGVLLALVDYGFEDVRVSRGKMGWSMAAEAAGSPGVSIRSFRAARYASVQQVSPLLRAVQNVALELAIEWLLVVPSIEQTSDLVALQTSLQRGEIPQPMCSLLWELGFVDIISGPHLTFVWRNPAF